MTKPSAVEATASPTAAATAPMIRTVADEPSDIRRTLPRREP
jgi:hypothetical protein